MSKIIQWFKKVFHDENSISSQMDRIVEQVQKAKNEYEPKILEWFSDNWYTLLSKDTRAFFYSYRVMKWKQLETAKDFSLQEMINIVTQ